jgi:NADH-quinone oxidoreductase subunit N
MLNQLLFTVFEISFTDYFFQILNFLSFFTLLSFINQNKFYLETTFTLSNLCYYFIDDEEEILTENDFSFSNEYLANSAIFNGSISLDEAKDSFNSYFSDFLATTEDYIFGYDSASYLYLPYCEFFEAESLELNNGFFMFFIAAFAFAALYFFFRELGDEESEMILNFIQLGFTFLTATHDLFTLFLGFEFLTISFVLGMVLMQEKYSYSRNVITYFILNVAVSLVIFFFCFFILLICSNTLFFGLNFSFFFSEMLMLENFLDEVFVDSVYNFLLKFFFLNLIILFFFKFTVGPLAVWTVFLYPTFPVIILVLQMVFLKMVLYFLFLEIFDFLFFFDASLFNFSFKIFSFILILSMFMGCFAYKINDIKSIFIITTFSQIAYVSISFISSSFLLLIYSFNYFLLYLYSTLVIFFIFIIANLFYNCQTLNDLASLKTLDFSLYCNFIAVLFSMAGLPPFMGFFVKYFLILKLLTNPLLFKFGVILLLTSFITTYIYLSIIYNLMKTTTKSIFEIDYFALNYTNKTIYSVFLYESVSLIINSFIISFVVFLLSPFFFLLVPETDEFFEFFCEWNIATAVEFVEYYLD